MTLATAPYHSVKTTTAMPRLPLEGNLDLTYRCNNVCRHCWLWLAENASERANELTFDEIRGIVDSARAMGTRKWLISGGEPMLREDFGEIFDYITRKATTYSINTNGTLITPELAHLLKRKGNKMIALYGATAETYDHVTRNPGGFEMVMRGFRYMQEAGAGFTVQLIAMRDNWHEWEQMKALARSLSPHWRIGPPWIYLSADGNATRNAEMKRQRLAPADVVALDQPDLSFDEEWSNLCGPAKSENDDCLFAPCVTNHRSFHIDPYGSMSFCSYIKDPSLRYDLRQGTFREAWDVFIPSLANKVRGDAVYAEHCGTCDLRDDCRWCAAFGYLEHGSFTARVESLCAVAKENRKYKVNWLTNHRRYFRIGGITIKVESDLPIVETTFNPMFKLFQVDGPGDDTITIRHHFELPDLRGQDLGQEIYRKPPWAIYAKEDAWVYLGLVPNPDDPALTRIVTFNHAHTHARIYNSTKSYWENGDLHALTMFPSDQILIARLLADRQGCFIHSAGAVIDGKGLLFVGHSEAGKTTTVRMLTQYGHSAQDGGTYADDSATSDIEVEILCDDRNIVRWVKDEFRVYGTWSHGESPLVSPADAPLHAFLFLRKSEQNRITQLTDRQEITRRLLACLIKPFVTRDWWDKTLNVIEMLVRNVPCYEMEFDKSGAIVAQLQKEVIDQP
jgi:MoaA/NifB/PqqE/SkfB family radical SAM enzyme